MAGDGASLAVRQFSPPRQDLLRPLVMTTASMWTREKDGAQRRHRDATEYGRPRQETSSAPPWLPQPEPP
jgi:hypothetical protein